jgi:hypothetical protein
MELKEEGRRKKEEGRRKRQQATGNRQQGRRKKEEGRRIITTVNASTSERDICQLSTVNYQLKRVVNFERIGASMNFELLDF